MLASSVRLYLHSRQRAMGWRVTVQ